MNSNMSKKGEDILFEKKKIQAENNRKINLELILK